MPGDEEDLSAARAEQKRAMDAASVTRTSNGKSAGKEGTDMDAKVDMDIKLPGGGTLGAGGAMAKDTPAGVVVRRASSPLLAALLLLTVPWLAVRSPLHARGISASEGSCLRGFVAKRNGT